MKNRILNRTLLVLSAIFIGSPAFSAGADTAGTGKQAEDTIWTLEEAYFSNLYKANYKQVLFLVQDQFLGWPGGLQHPINKEESALFMRQLIPKPTSCRILIEKEGIRISGTVTLTHYALRVSCPDSAGGTKTQTSRITHTWVKEGGTWKLLGGMSSDK